MRYSLKEIFYYLGYRLPLIIKGRYITDNLIRVHWGRGLNNFGDCLQPDILKHYGLTPVYVSQKDADIILAGSILQWVPTDFKGYIIGTGGDNFKYNFPNAKILAVRGKLTLSNISGCVEDIKLGDPGLLMSYVFPEKSEVKYKLGVIPHFVDKDSDIILNWRRRFGSDVLFIDVLRPPKQVISEIKQCASIVSSSLHGLIIADAFHIPNMRFVNRQTMPTSFYDYKFDDYYSSLNCKSLFIEANGQETAADLIKSATLKPIDRIRSIQADLDHIMIEVANKFRMKE